MERHDLELKELRVTESIGLSFHGLYLVVGSLQRAGGDGVFVPTQKSCSVCAKVIRAEIKRGEGNCNDEHELVGLEQN